MLTVDNLKFSYPKHSADDDEKGANTAEMQFNLDVQGGEILSIIGPSGSGKTTLLNLIAGFNSPSSGSIIVDDVDITPLKIHQRPVTTVFQDNNLFPHLDVFTNVAIGIQPSLKLSQDEKQHIHHALENVGLSDFHKRRPKELSGGQRQRIALARALVRKQSVLLLDEPLAALGPAMKDEIIDLLKAMVEEQNMAALLISHQPTDAFRASKRTAFINQGKIHQIGNTADVLGDSADKVIKQYLGES
ncbi:ATP-binding cassette domain-containing protein [Cocleimonas sp. KMM 6892]|uniref:thiamine ABC transporter ATP-binding protein n=1 Tax=unclassified Cocleimonas TaxID=2639732 RepID=UPI002DBB027A|nr:MULTISPECIES: ATP-binding cassette domain-containing protein [unclassified Cocleimonas]MEB8434126.1 ATP-binding cassette domain-containing protein [Cocleimonas sp. KMM 6892]MEC4717014.1 ATP-binding cassette domain-containing protein [Cocleimonas sp. KMM 6895]MEC4746398.1 ATP-binding cassette domain-containing protein [Cocleimonas sp. KMM 6896]